MQTPPTRKSRRPQLNFRLPPSHVRKERKSLRPRTTHTRALASLLSLSLSSSGLALARCALRTRPFIRDIGTAIRIGSHRKIDSALDRYHIDLVSDRLSISCTYTSFYLLHDRRRAKLIARNVHISPSVAVITFP